MRKAFHVDQSWSDYAPGAPKTPWGKAQYAYNLDRGVRWFGTAGHGGLQVSAGAARAKLSDAARKMGEHWGGSFWYEEDIQYAIAFLENPDWAAKMHLKGGGSPLTHEYLEKQVRQWFPRYFDLLEQGFKLPEPLKAGDAIRFEREIKFGRGAVFKVGDVQRVFSVTRSSIIFGSYSPSYRLPMSYYNDGDVTRVPDGAVALRSALLKLAHEVPETRKHLVPLLRGG